jgi:hypothetical protein
LPGHNLDIFEAVFEAQLIGDLMRYIELVRANPQDIELADRLVLRLYDMRALESGPAQFFQ